MEKNYRLTLSRWHKVSERLTRRATELSKAMRDGFNRTEIMGYLGEGQQARLIKQGEQLAGELAPLFELQDTVVRIRQLLGAANEKAGISAELARLDMLNKRLKFLEGIVEGQSSDKVMLDELPSLPLRIDDDDYYGKPKTFSVCLMDEAILRDFEQQLDSCRAESYGIADAIAEKNRQTLVISLSDEVAKHAGLPESLAAD